MPLSQLRNVNFGRTRLNATGSTGVGYQLLDETGSVQSSRTTTGVYQTAPGIYAAYITFPDNFRGQVLWDTGTTFPSTFYATEQYNVEENDPRVASVHAQTTYISGATAGISSSVGSVISVLSQVSGNVDQINDTTLQTFSTVSSMQSQVTQMSGTINDIYDIVFDLSGTITSLSSSANILSSSVYAISSSATLISASAAIIDNSVSMLSGAIAELAGITGTLGNIETKVDRLIDIQYGRWFIDNNQMIFYKEDNVTEVARFDLFDENGNPTMDAVFDRVKL
jgi:uncharacterized protein YoxC